MFVMVKVMLTGSPNLYVVFSNIIVNFTGPYVVSTSTGVDASLCVTEFNPQTTVKPASVTTTHRISVFFKEKVIQFPTYYKEGTFKYINHFFEQPVLLLEYQLFSAKRVDEEAKKHRDLIMALITEVRREKAENLKKSLHVPVTVVTAQSH